MWSRNSSNDGLVPSAGGRNVAAQPTCMWAVGVSTSRNDASSAESRADGIERTLPRCVSGTASRRTVADFGSAPKPATKPLLRPLRAGDRVGDQHRDVGKQRHDADAD